MDRIMKKLSLMALGAVLLLSACKKDSDDPPGPDPSKAKVMFGHTTISADTLSVSINNSMLGFNPGLSFLSTTNYVDVDPGAATVTFKIASAQIDLASVNTTFAANNSYSVFATGVVTSPSAVVTTDDLSAPPSGSAKVRFINLSSDALSESFFVGPNKLDSNIQYKGVTPFRTVTAGSYNIVALPDAPKQHLVKTLASVPLSAGKIYTIMLYGTENGAGAAQLNMKVISNN